MSEKRNTQRRGLRLVGAGVMAHVQGEGSLRRAGD